MGSGRERSQIEFRGVARAAEVRCALLALEGVRAEELRSAAALTAQLGDHCLLVAVGGGMRACTRARRRPDLFVGGDGALRHVPASVPSVFIPPDRNDGDLAGALRELRDRGVQIIVAAGLLGRRLDLEWASLLEIASASRWFAGLVAPTRRGLVIVTRHGCRAATPRNRPVSLLSLCGSATVTMRGTRRTLSRRRIPPGSLGLSNVTGTDLQLRVHAGTIALVLSPH